VTSEEHEPGVRVTIGVMYREIQSQGDILLRIDGRGERSEEKIAELQAIIAALEARVRVLENYRWQSIGAFGIILLVAGWGFTWAVSSVT